MTIREDLVASAAQFLQDPSVAASPVENRVAFLKAKNLTEEEVHAALSRAGPDQGPAPSYAAPPPGAVSGPQPAYYGGYPPHGWQQPPPAVPRRDWRDWFIMATVVGGVGYGLYALGKRYVYPLVAPPTPERLESDKKSIDEQFEKAFLLVEQLSKDTEELKAAEEQRNEKLNNALFELETVISDLKSSNRRREDEAQRIRDDVHGLKDSVPKALDAQKNLTDTRLQEINSELKSLKTIISQRMTSQQPPSSTNPIFNRPSVPAPVSAPSPVPATSSSNGAINGNAAAEETPKPSSGPSVQDYAASTGRSSPFNSGISAATVKIPEWQRAIIILAIGDRRSSTDEVQVATKKSSTSALNGGTADGASVSQPEAGGSSS